MAFILKSVKDLNLRLGILIKVHTTLATTDQNGAYFFIYFTKMIIAEPTKMLSKIVPLERFNCFSTLKNDFENQKFAIFCCFVDNFVKRFVVFLQS